MDQKSFSRFDYFKHPRRKRVMDYQNTAFIFIGYQNDYFSETGILRAVIEEADRTGHILDNTRSLLGSLQDKESLLIQTPIIFTEDYRELVNPVGILKSIKQARAFQRGSDGAECISAFQAYGDRIKTLEGKRGLNAFSNTELDRELEQHNISHVVLAGAVTSICIDSTGRAAHERGYRVTILSDCTASRTPEEQRFYCENIFPLYAEVTDHRALMESLEVLEACEPSC